MAYDPKIYWLARHYAQDHALTDAETAKLAQFIQDEIDGEIDWILKVRKEPHGTD